MSARAEPRFTRDVDVAVLVNDDADGEELVRSMLADHYRLLAPVEQEQTGRLATVRLGCPVGDGDVVVDPCAAKECRSPPGWTQPLM